MGARKYDLIEKYPAQLTGCILEIGSERSEGSTTYLSHFAKITNKPFYTVDFNKDSYLNALRITGGHGAYHMTGEEFLGNIFPLLNQEISFAYLDNFDLVTHDGRNWDQRKALYKSYGIDMNNTNAKIAHMTQALLVERYAAHKCFILFDDTWIDSTTNEVEGKGAWAIRPLTQCGFKLMNEIYKGNEADGLINGYVLMARGY